MIRRRHAFLLLLPLVVSCENAEGIEVSTIIHNTPYGARIEGLGALQTGTTTIIRVETTFEGEAIAVEDTLRMLHVMLASADMRDTFHTFQPESVGHGLYEIRHAFTQPGPYRLWVEIENIEHDHAQRHGERADLIGYIDFIVSGSPQPSAFDLVGATEGVVDGHVIRYEHSPLRVGQETLFEFSVSGSDGQKIELPEYDPFLYFATNENFSFYSHGHMLTNDDFHSATLRLTFPQPGLYVLWAETYVYDEAGMLKKLVIPFQLQVN